MYVLTAIKKISADKMICYSPGEYHDEIRKWLGNDYSFFKQTGTGLGERMFNAFNEKFQEGYKNLIIIGTDVPYLNVSEFEKSFNALEKNDIVIGPSKDGGYYMIGFKKETFSVDAFINIPWSTNEVYKKTISILRKKKFKILKTKKCHDIDLPEDLKYLYSRYQNGKFIGEFTSKFFEKYKVEIGH